jgi:hypothetical protein
MPDRLFSPLQPALDDDRQVRLAVSMPDRLFSPLQLGVRTIHTFGVFVSMPDRLFSPLQQHELDGDGRSLVVSMPDRLFSPLQPTVARGESPAPPFQCRIGFSPRCNTGRRTAGVGRRSVSMPDRLFSPLQPSCRSTACHRAISFNAGSAFLPAATLCERSRACLHLFQCRIGFSPRCNTPVAAPCRRRTPRFNAGSAFLPAATVGPLR